MALAWNGFCRVPEYGAPPGTTSGVAVVLVVVLCTPTPLVFIRLCSVDWGLGLRVWCG